MSGERPLECSRCGHTGPGFKASVYVRTLIVANLRSDGTVLPGRGRNHVSRERPHITCPECGHSWPTSRRALDALQP